MDKPQHVNPGFPVGGENVAICWSERISYKRAVLSSEAVAKAYPLGWNYKMG